MSRTTFIKQDNLTRGISTEEVDIDWDRQSARVNSDKQVNQLIVYKPRDGTAFFKVAREGKGNVPIELEGHFSSLLNAVKAIQFYLDNSQETNAAKSERLASYRASKAQPKERS